MDVPEQPTIRLILLLYHSLEAICKVRQVLISPLRTLLNTLRIGIYYKLLVILLTRTLSLYFYNNIYDGAPAMAIYWYIVHTTMIVQFNDCPCDSDFFDIISPPLQVAMRH